MAKPKVTLFGEIYPKKSSEEKIEIYLTSKPNREYIEFAKITCNDTNDKWNLEQIVKKAKEIGADGILILGKAGTTAFGVPIGNFTYVVSEEHGITAIAIKFK